MSDGTGAGSAQRLVLALEPHCISMSDGTGAASAQSSDLSCSSHVGVGRRGGWRCGGVRSAGGDASSGGSFFGDACASASISIIALLKISLRAVLADCGVGRRGGCRCGGVRGVACASSSISLIALLKISLRSVPATGFGVGSRGGCRCGDAFRVGVNDDGVGGCRCRLGSRLLMLK